MTLSLVSVLDTPAATPLRRGLLRLAETAEPIQLDGSAVDRVGTACLQVLSAGQAAARHAGREFRIADPSPALVEMATLAGFDDLFAA
ncbi:MAG: STAS domain-containing protein [Sphingomonas bacterium]|nr:STAS domain-containing protein [Sphingomonas bacterium]